ncbi:MAG: hypothetical protein WCA07_00945 [Gloeobacterales cyanobacterium]
MTNQQPEQLQGVVERLTYHSEESGYTVALLKAPRAREPITIIGNFAHIPPGQMKLLKSTARLLEPCGVYFPNSQT